MIGDYAADGNVPITSCLFTSASTHDNQATIPVVVTAAERVNCCNSTNAGYDS